MLQRTNTQRKFTVLVTGFTSFPGARTNPTEALATILPKRQARFAKLGITLEARILPVVYATIAPAIAEHVRALSPDLILHFGLAARRSHICIESVARNCLNTIHADADGRLSPSATIRRGGPAFVRARIATTEIVAALRRSGHFCRLSNDAGDYLCNAAFYLSLTAPHAPHVGFIHVPHVRSLNRRTHGPLPRLTMPGLVRAAETAIIVAAKAARREERSGERAAALARLRPVLST
jgi:pyroglutamyl-peptidase